MYNIKKCIGALTLLLWLSGKSHAFVVYDDTLAPNWQDWSWSTSIQDSVYPVYIGTRSIIASYNEPWSGLYFANPAGMSTTGTDVISFAINSGPAGGANLFVELYGADHGSLGKVPLSSYIPQGYLFPDTWYYVTIPLADLNAEDTVVTGFSVISETYALVYFDAVEFRDAGFNSLIPYGEGLGPRWTKNWSWETSVEPYGAMPYAGSYGLGVAYNKPWAGLWLHSEKPVSTNDINSLSFFIRTEVAGANFYASLTDTNDRELGYIPLAKYVPGSILAANTWYKIFIPLADLKAENTTIAGIVVQSDMFTAASFDEIIFSAGLGPFSSPLAANPECWPGDSQYPASPGIRLIWEAVRGADSYDIYREGALIRTNFLGTNFWNIKDLTAGKSYTYQVVAKNAAGIIRKSETIRATASINCKVALCDPPRGMYVRGGLGLYEGIIEGQSTGGTTTASFRLNPTEVIFDPLNPLKRRAIGLWFSIEEEYDFNIVTVVPDQMDALGGGLATLGFIGPDLRASFTTRFCRAGVATFKLKYDITAAAITAIESIIEVSPSVVLDLADDLLNIPLFSSAVSHLTNAWYIEPGVGKEAMLRNMSRELSLAGADLVKLVWDTNQRNQFITAFARHGYEVGIRDWLSDRMTEWLTGKKVRFPIVDLLEQYLDGLVLYIQQGGGNRSDRNQAYSSVKDYADQRGIFLKYPSLGNRFQARLE